MSSAIAQGVPGVTLDVDLWVGLPERSYMRLVNLCLDLGLEQLRPTVFSDRRSLLLNFCYRLDGLRSFNEELKKAEWIAFEGAQVQALPLERIIRSKEAAGRDKDKAVLPVLKDTLRSIRELKKKGFLQSD